MSKRIAVVDNTKLKDMDKKLHVQSLCPVNRTGKECIVIEGKKLSIDESLCIGCGICANYAPDAIKIINLPEALTKQPIHRYGTNGFVLYNLPIPIFGSVVGILGINGIGKSTAIKIIAGLLQPNLGEDIDCEIDAVIDYFKGTEAQLFFQKVKAREIKVSYKPQQVDHIPKQYDGTVRELLRKVDEKGTISEVSKKLQINTLLDSNIKEVSGGELQRVAIAATLLKKANVYIFDEPTSYLDIKQRLRISHIIRELCDEDTAVLIIEHDLIALDYLADLVHIMYGAAGAYGIVSQVKSTKNGINIYLDGYLKEENVRFREGKIKFEVKAPIKAGTDFVLTKWPELKKNLGQFKLTADPGEIYYNEKVGILGENGIGKTTFVKILAGVIESDSGKVDDKVKVAYKPQYIDNESTDLVMSLLHVAVSKYDTELIGPLNIKPLLLKQIDQLSGGELQRVAICHCLSQDAELMLLDEPSAYLDIEQRLIVSKVISNVTEQRRLSILVVDHDLLFLDYLSDRLLVFDGVPAKEGKVNGPFTMEQGMNSLLTELKITLRRDEISGRPRINKLGSVKDREQKLSRKYYYS